MDDIAFDRLIMQLSRIISRRAMFGGLSALTFADLVDAKNKRK